MRVVRFSDLEELAPYASDWDRLAAGNPFRSWAWASTWWRHYGAAGNNGGSRLCVLGVKDGKGRLTGIAPWSVEPSGIWGGVLRFLGSGEVCSEYLGVLAEAGREEVIAGALADWLAGASAPADRWDMAELTSVDAEDFTTRLLIRALHRRNLMVHCRPGPSCWRIELPRTLQDYFVVLSRSRRRKIYRAEKQWLNTGRAQVHVARTAEDLARAQDVLIDLHRRRHESLGKQGCFDAGRCTAFHREVMRQLLAQNRLLLYWVSIDGRPVAAEYMLRGGGVVYAYQAGMAPESLAMAPGQLSLLIGIRHAIGEGYSAFDFLRGDEPYKAHWRAAPRPVLEFRFAAPRRTSRARLGLWLAGSRVKEEFKAMLRPGARVGQAASLPWDRQGASWQLALRGACSAAAPTPRPSEAPGVPPEPTRCEEEEHLVTH
jgi:CelD/BcsL family acetyltransferase involved in cellulose biosynthesis